MQSCQRGWKFFFLHRGAWQKKFESHCIKSMNRICRNQTPDTTPLLITVFGVSVLFSMTLKFIKAAECAPPFTDGHAEHTSHQIRATAPPGCSISCLQLRTAACSHLHCTAWQVVETSFSRLQCKFGPEPWLARSADITTPKSCKESYK